MHLRNQLDNATNLLDLLLSQSRDPAGLDNDRDLRETTLAENLAVASSESVNNRDLRRLSVHALAHVSRDKSPELVEVDDRLVQRVAQQVVVTHTNLTEVTRVVPVEVGAVVVETTSKTTTTGVLAVLADTTVTSRNVATVLPGLSEVSRHLRMLAPRLKDKSQQDSNQHHVYV